MKLRFGEWTANGYTRRMFHLRGNEMDLPSRSRGMLVEFPAGEHQDGRMTLESPGDDLRSPDSEIHAIVLNARDR